MEFQEQYDQIMSRGPNKKFAGVPPAKFGMTELNFNKKPGGVNTYFEDEGDLH